MSGPVTSVSMCGSRCFYSHSFNMNARPPRARALPRQPKFKCSTCTIIFVCVRFIWAYFVLFMTPLSLRVPNHERPHPEHPPLPPVHTTESGAILRKTQRKSTKTHQSVNFWLGYSIGCRRPTKGFQTKRNRHKEILNKHR